MSDDLQYLANRVQWLCSRISDRSYYPSMEDLITVQTFIAVLMKMREAPQKVEFVGGTPIATHNYNIADSVIIRSRVGGEHDKQDINDST